MSKEIVENKRMFLPNIAELLDVLTVLSLKKTYIADKKDFFEEEIGKVKHDINMLLKCNKIIMDANIIQDIMCLAQANHEIWKCKDLMVEFPNKYNEYLQLAHKMNAVRNQLKNKINKTIGTGSIAEQKTNLERIGLEGWEVEEE